MEKNSSNDKKRKNFYIPSILKKFAHYTHTHTHTHSEDAQWTMTRGFISPELGAFFLLFLLSRVHSYASFFFKFRIIDVKLTWLSLKRFLFFSSECQVCGNRVILVSRAVSSIKIRLAAARFINNPPAAVKSLSVSPKRYSDFFFFLFFFIIHEKENLIRSILGWKINFFLPSL